MCYQTPFPMFLAGLEHLWVLSTFSTRSPSPPLLALLPFLVLSVCFWVQRFVCLHVPGLCRQLYTEPNSCHSSSPQISLHLFLAQNLIPCHPQWPRDLNMERSQQSKSLDSLTCAKDTVLVPAQWSRDFCNVMFYTSLIYWIGVNWTHTCWAFIPTLPQWKDVIRRMNINPWSIVDPSMDLAQRLLQCCPTQAQSWLCKDISFYLNMVQFFSLLSSDYKPIWAGPSVIYLSRKDCKGNHAKESRAYCRTFPMKLVKKELKMITGP